MDPERWRHVEQLYQSVLALEESKRSAFLDDSCSGDEALRREVLSLLARHERADMFMETPAMEMMAKELAADKRRPAISDTDPASSWDAPFLITASWPNWGKAVWVSSIEPKTRDWDAASR